MCDVVPRAVSNPTLVHHGLVASSRWHILTHEPPRKAVADVYAGSQAIAHRVARTLANLLGEQLDLLDNSARPADLKAHPRSIVAPTASFAMNPARSKRARALRRYRRKATSRKIRRSAAAVTRRVKTMGGPKSSRLTPTRALPRAMHYQRAHEVRATRRLRANPKGRKSSLTATEYVRALHENGDAYHHGRITYAVFDKRSRAIWQMIQAAGLESPVLAKLRSDTFNTGDRFRLKIDVVIEPGETHAAGVHGTVTLADPSRPGTVYAVFDDTPTKFPEAVSTKWLEHVVGNPSRTKTARARRRGVVSHRQRRAIRKAQRAGSLKTPQARYQIISQIRRGTKRGLPHGIANPKGRKSTHGQLALFERFSFTMPLEAARDMSGPGPADEAVAYWSGRVYRPPTVTPAELAAELKEYGAWDADQLKDDDENWQRILWIAATNIMEDLQSNPRRNTKRCKSMHYDSSGAQHQGLATKAQALLAESGLHSIGLVTHGVVQRGKRWHVVVDPSSRALNRCAPMGVKHRRRRKARPVSRASGARRNPRIVEVAQAAKTVRKWKDMGPVSVATKRMRAPAALKGVAAELGKLVGVVYRSDKYDGKSKDYEHDFSNPLPSLVTDPDAKGLHIVGGRYKITSDGIVN
jgi:hypothetical protein